MSRWFWDRPGTSLAMSTACAWWGYIICRNMTSASLKSVRVALGAGDVDEPPCSIPGIDPLVAVELETVGDAEVSDASSPHPATVRAAATAAVRMADLTTVVELNMKVLHRRQVRHPHRRRCG